MIPKFKMHKIIENSYRDYHVKGFDYICLKRTPEHTVKFYFFDGLSKAYGEDLVIPHDHAYDFGTTVVAGRMRNVIYQDYFSPVPMPLSKPLSDEEVCGMDISFTLYNRFRYHSKLRNGIGFEYAGRRPLRIDSVTEYAAKERYLMHAEDIHTIHVQQDCILRLDQFKTRRGATTSYSESREPPELSGLYNRFTPDQVVARLAQIGMKVE